MESTGVYWKPVWAILEDRLTLVLGNAHDLKNVPGRKSDVKDSKWIADLLAHGLIRASFVPPAPIQEMRDITRTRKQLIREITQHVQRLGKVLESANIKLSSVLTDIMGTSGRKVIEALIANQTDPEKLLPMISRRVKASKEQLREALRGRINEHHRFLLGIHLEQIRASERSVAELEARLGGVLDNFREAVDRLATIPGVSLTVASVILAEIGVDMSRFPTAGHLISWAGLCPRSDESAGKKLSSRLRKGSNWLKTVLVQAAWAATRAKSTYLQAQFLRIKSRRGPKKAILAVAASMLTSVYYMLTRNQDYQELGGNYFLRRDRSRLVKNLVNRLKELGVEVTVPPAA
jgi:transposase